jgi:hypothetical protein
VTSPADRFRIWSGEANPRETSSKSGIAAEGGFPLHFEGRRLSLSREEWKILHRICPQ